MIRRTSGWLLSILGIAALTLSIGAALGLISFPFIALIWRSIENQSWNLPLDEKVPMAVLLSFKTTAISLILIILMGTPLAYVLGRWRFPGRRLLNTLVELPIVIPPAVAGLGLLVAFGRRGLLGPALQDFGIRLAFTQQAVIMAQIFVAMPFYVRAAQIGFQEIDREIEQAALVDGATPFWRFVYVTLPLSSRALLSGALISWARALGEFGATIFFAGSLPGRTQTMTTLIYNIFEQDINAAIWTALLLIGIAAVVVGITRFLIRDEQRSSVN